MAENSIWVTSVEKNNSSRPIIEYIIDQGNDLSKQTNGKIKGVLVKAGAAWDSFVDILTLLGSQIPYHPTHHNELNDASELYKKRTFEFLIVDEIHKYELSVFQITCNDTMPVKLRIDPTIAREEKLEESSDIRSLETFKDIFEEIVTSEKVVYIISRLLSLPDPQTEVDEKALPNPESNSEEE